MLREAICKIEGFKYKPVDVFHGHSSERRFIHVTKEFVNVNYLKSIASHLDIGQSLLVYGLTIQSDMNLPDNIEVKKIPKDCFCQAQRILKSLLSPPILVKMFYIC